MRPARAATTIGLWLTLLGADATAQANHALTSTPKDRSALALTIYNNGIGLVRERRHVELTKRGRVQLNFHGVAPTIKAPSVALTATDAPDAMDVAEQSYRFDVLSPQTLAARSVGLPISIHRTNPGSGDVVKVAGSVLADFQGNHPVLRTGEGITYYRDALAMGFGSLPENWVSEPMLSWQLRVRQPGAHELGVSYLAGGMSWSADYVLVLGKKKETPSTMVGWITLVNRSGMSFENAHLAVVAGQVNRVEETPKRPPPAMRPRLDSRLADSPKASRSKLSEYHLYHLPNATTLDNRSSKQVTFLLTNSLRPQLRYVVGERRWRFSGSHAGARTTQPAQTELRFDVSEKQGLGVPLPSGTVRVFASGRQGQAQLVGQSTIGHTPKDETVKLRIGNAPEIRLTRKLTDRRSRLGRAKDTVSYTLRNAKPKPVVVEVRERMGKLDRATIPTTHPDARTTLFVVEVPAGGEVVWRAEYTEVWR